jgi:hypothetical protein
MGFFKFDRYYKSLKINDIRLLIAHGMILPLLTVKSDGRYEKVRAKVLQSVNRSYLYCIGGPCCSGFYTLRNGDIISYS